MVRAGAKEVVVVPSRVVVDVAEFAAGAAEDAAEFVVDEDEDEDVERVVVGVAEDVLPYPEPYVEL